MIVTMRGDYGEANPWQIPMGQATPKVLSEIGMRVFQVDTIDDAHDALDAGMTMAYEASAPVAILVSQRLIGAKPFRSDPELLAAEAAS
jgi:sulfopyruvate decarboxylase TPP-binding subunit